MTLRSRRRSVLKSNVLQSSAGKLKEVEDALKRRMPETTKQVGERVLPMPEHGDNMSHTHPHEEDQSMGSSPYGIADSHNYHAICEDTNGTIRFLSNETKEGLAVMLDDNEDYEILAIYGGNLLRYEEKISIEIS